MPDTILGNGDTSLNQRQNSSQAYVLELRHKSVNMTGE